MVHLRTVESENLKLVKDRPLVAVIAGGTSGIGAYTACALAKVHGTVGRGLRLYIIGRNVESAQKVTDECRQACPSGRFTFIKADDLALLKDVDRVCAKVTKLEKQEDFPRIDILLMTQACPPWRAQKDTTEGLDILTSLLHYSRMRMTSKFLPLLTASASPAHVISVFAGGMEAKFIADDLGVRKPENYSLSQVRSHVTYMKTFYMRHIVQSCPGKLSFVHAFPGLVNTPSFQDSEMPLLYRILWTLLGPLVVRLIAVSADESGARILSLANPRYAAIEENVSEEEMIAAGTDGKRGSGVYSINWNGESCSVQQMYQKLDQEAVSKAVIDHTDHVFQQVEHNGIVDK